MKRFLIIFAVVNLALSAFYVDLWLTPNPGSRAIPMITIFEEGTLKIDRYERFTLDKSLIDGHYYSDKAPLSTFITLPFYDLARLLGLDQRAPETYQAYPRAYTAGNDHIETDSRVFPAFWAYLTGGLVCGSLVFTAILLVAFREVRRRAGPISPVWLVCLPFYGSFVFLYAGAFFGHLLAALFLLLSFILLDKGKAFFCAGFLLGLAFLAEYPVALALPLWAALIGLREKRWQPVVCFLGGFLPLLLMNALYVYLITGDPFSMPYSYVSDEQFAPMRDSLGFGFPSLQALWGLLVSPYRGLLLYAPFLIPALVYFLRYGQVRRKALLLDYGTVFCVCYVLLMASYYMWDGGFSYGPRHLLPVAVLLIYRGVLLVARTGISRSIFYSVTAFGLVMSWMAKSTVAFLADPDVSNPFFSIIIPEFVAGRFNPHNLLSIIFGLPPGAAVLAWPVFFLLSLFMLDYGCRKTLEADATQVCAQKVVD